MHVLCRKPTSGAAQEVIFCCICLARQRNHKQGCGLPRCVASCQSSNTS